MRKLISLGLLGLIWSLLAGPVVANDENDCDTVIDETPGLYGLCIAYHHAGNSNAEDRILINYRRKMEPGDTDLLELGGGGVPCLCWTLDQMANATSHAPAHDCKTGAFPESVVYGSASMAVVSFVVFSNACFYVGPDGIKSLPLSDSNDIQDCSDGIQALIDEDFDGITCTTEN